MLSLAGAVTASELPAPLTSLGAVVRIRFHQNPSGRLLISLQPTAHVQQPMQRSWSMTIPHSCAPSSAMAAHAPSL